MDAIEADGTVYIMTERVRPLSAELPSWEAKPVNERQDWLTWGLHRITVRAAAHHCSPENRHTLSRLNTALPLADDSQNALSFINSSCNAAHGTVRIGSIFLSVSGEWKLGGFELFSDPSEPNAILVVRVLFRHSCQRCIVSRLLDLCRRYEHTSNARE